MKKPCLSSLSPSPPSSAEIAICYNSEGEKLLMKGDEQEAVKM